MYIMYYGIYYNGYWPWYSYCNNCCLPTEGSRIWKLSNPQGWMSQFFLSIWQDSEKLGSNASKEMDSPVRATASQQRKKNLLMCQLYNLTWEGVAQNKGVSFHFKRFRLKVGFPISNYLIKKKIFSRCTQSLEF